MNRVNIVRNLQDSLQLQPSSFDTVMIYNKVIVLSGVSNSFSGNRGKY